MAIHIREITTEDPVYPQVWELREAVLRKPLGLSLKDEDLIGEKSERIFIAEDGDRVLGCVMLKAIPGPAFKLRQMAVAPEMQGRKVGRNLVEAAERAAWASSASRIEMHARAAVLPFYEKLGYAVVGEEFSEVNIPHRAMQKHRPA